MSRHKTGYVISYHGILCHDYRGIPTPTCMSIYSFDIIMQKELKEYFHTVFQMHIQRQFFAIGVQLEPTYVWSFKWLAKFMLCLFLYYHIQENTLYMKCFEEKIFAVSCPEVVMCGNLLICSAVFHKSLVI